MKEKLFSFDLKSEKVSKEISFKLTYGNVDAE